MHKPNTRQRDTLALTFWRIVDAELVRLRVPRVGFGEVETLRSCGYSVNEVLRVLAPSHVNSNLSR